MRILGIDFGLKKIGLAFSDGELAEPLMTLRVKNGPERVVKKIKTICSEKGVEKIVIGLAESGIKEETRHFGEELKEAISLPVIYQEETLTSREAIVKMVEARKRRKFRHLMEDAVAAALILQSYLEKDNV